MLEATCQKCGDTFNPSDEDDLVHFVRTSDDEHQGDECGGVGVIDGEWIFTPRNQPAAIVVGDDDHPHGCDCGDCCRSYGEPPIECVNCGRDIVFDAVAGWVDAVSDPADYVRLCDDEGDRRHRPPAGITYRRHRPPAGITYPGAGGGDTVDTADSEMAHAQTCEAQPQHTVADCPDFDPDYFHPYGSDQA